MRYTQKRVKMRKCEILYLPGRVLLRGGTAMIKLLGPNNDLRTEDGVITKLGYLVAIMR